MPFADSVVRCLFKSRARSKKKRVANASKESPQYAIKSDKTDHIAIHKGTALQLIPSPKKAGSKTRER
jgi:hypothetical protein